MMHIKKLAQRAIESQKLRDKDDCGYDEPCDDEAGFAIEKIIVKSKSRVLNATWELKGSTLLHV